MATHFRRERIDYAVSFDDHDVVETRETVRARTKVTEITTTNAARDTAISNLIDDDGWVVGGVIPIIETRSHKTDRQEVMMAYTYVSGCEVILYKNGDD